MAMSLCVLQKHARAFTLLELLIVTTIIGLMVALLIPALAGARRKSHEARCLGNVRQIGISFIGEAIIDPAGRFEPTEIANWLGRSLGKETLGWTCPSAKKTGRVANNRDTSEIPPWNEQWQIDDIQELLYSASGIRGDFAPKKRNGGYGFNYWLSGFGSSPTAPWKGEPAFFRSEGSLKNPSLVPVVADAATWWVLPRATDTPPPLPQPDIYYHLAMRWLCVARHGGGGNRNKWNATKRLPGSICIAFFDGHAALVPLESLWGLEWSVNYSPPSPRPGVQ